MPGVAVARLMRLPTLHPALRLTLWYALAAGAWIILSDRVLAALTSDPLLLTRLQTAKGWAFVASTGLFLYLFVRREIAKIEHRDALVRSTETALRVHGAALHAAANAVAIADAAGRVLWVNSAFTRLTGYAAEEAIGRPLHHQGVTGQDATFDRILQEIALSGCPWHGEIAVSRKDGTPYTEEQTITPVKDQTGAISHLIAIAQDVTAREEAEAALATERNLLRTLIDNLPDYIFIKDPQSRFVMINRAQAALLGVRSPEEAVGKTDQDFLPAALAAQYRTDEECVVRSGEPLLNHEERGPSRDDDEPEWHLTTKVPLRDSRGGIVGVVGISRNITALKRTERRADRAHPPTGGHPDRQCRDHPRTGSDHAAGPDRAARGGIGRRAVGYALSLGCGPAGPRVALLAQPGSADGHPGPAPGGRRGRNRGGTAPGNDRQRLPDVPLRHPG